MFEMKMKRMEQRRILRTRIYKELGQQPGRERTVNMLLVTMLEEITTT